MADLEKNPEHTEESATNEEEDTGAVIAPIVRLEEVAVTTGEEEEEVLLDLKAKLYRFDKEGNQWKERGAGSVKLLKHKETNKVRLVMRQSKTLKICANHLVLPSTSVQEHAGNEKSCVWHATDFSDGELKEELFCIRFATIENCRAFKEMVQEVAESQGDKTESKEVTFTAEFVEKLSVAETKKEEKADEKEVVPSEENNGEKAPPCSEEKKEEIKIDDQKAKSEEGK